MTPTQAVVAVESALRTTLLDQRLGALRGPPNVDSTAASRILRVLVTT